MCVCAFVFVFACLVAGLFDCLSVCLIDGLIVKQRSLAARIGEEGSLHRRSGQLASVLI